jgi:surface polysaccharide O-acyltransferase-like enzyme
MISLDERSFPMKRRMREMDVIRAVSALSIIMIHVSGVYTASSRSAYLINQLVRFAVPVFILISGLLLSVSGYEYNGVSGYLKFLSKRLKKIFIPYVLWSLIFILFNMRDDLSPIRTDPGGFLADTGKKLLYGSAHAHLYFIIIILQLYLLFPVLRALMKVHGRIVLAASFVLTLVFQTGVYLQAMEIMNFPAPILPNYMFFPTWIFYFVFGIYFASRLESYEVHAAKKTVLFAVAWVLSLVVLMADSRLTETFDLSIKPAVLLYSMVSFFLLYSLALRLKDSKLKILGGLDWISRQSFTIYLSHLFIIKILLLLTGHPADSGLWSGPKGLAALYLAGTLCTCLFAWLVSVTPFASALGGVRKTRHG